MINPAIPKELIPWSQAGGDGKTHQIKWYTTLLLKPEEQVADSSPEIHICDLRLRSLPSIVYFFIPGNPGVTTAYQPWLYHLSEQLGPQSLVCISSHLGHLSTSHESFRFTCEDNIIHQEKILFTIISDICRCTVEQGGELPKIVCCGHSAGAYFIVHALDKLLRRNDTLWPNPQELRDCIQMILYCGTLIQFGASGRLKALVAASNSGVKLLRKFRKSQYAMNRVSQNFFLQLLNEEFSDAFLANMSALTRDELDNLPYNIHSQFELIKSFNIKLSFFFAENDSYVSKKIQQEYVKAFGRERVYISNAWWHAFALHTEGLQEAVILTEAVIRSPSGLIPQSFQNDTRPSSGTAIMFDCRSFLASVIVSVWLGCQSLYDLLSHHSSIFTSFSTPKRAGQINQ